MLKNDELERLRVLVAPLHQPPAPGKIRVSLRKLKQTLLTFTSPTEEKPKAEKQEKVA